MLRRIYVETKLAALLRWVKRVSIEPINIAPSVDPAIPDGSWNVYKAP